MSPSSYRPVESVLMTDGRFVDFAEGRKLWKSSYITQDGEVCVRLDFRNGQTRTLVVPPDQLPAFAADGAERRVDAAIKGVPDLDRALQRIDALISRLTPERS